MPTSPHFASIIKSSQAFKASRLEFAPECTSVKLKSPHFWPLLGEHFKLANELLTQEDFVGRPAVGIARRHRDVLR